MDFPVDDFTPLWARIGEGAGGFLWFLAMVFLAVAAISLFRAGKHPAAKGLRLVGFSVFFWVGATIFGAIVREVASFPPLVHEIGLFGQMVVGVVLAVVGGLVDFGLFGLALIGAMKASKALRAASEGVTAKKPAIAKPAVAKPAPRPVPKAAAPSRVQGTTAGAATARPKAPAAEKPVVATPPPVVAKPAVARASGPDDIEALIKEAGFAKPARVFTVREASQAPAPSLATSEGAPPSERASVERAAALLSSGSAPRRRTLAARGGRLRDGRLRRRRSNEQRSRRRARVRGRRRPAHGLRLGGLLRGPRRRQLPGRQPQLPGHEPAHLRDAR
jgi:hypothetical protein